MKIMEKQKKFADLYLKYGDATKAYAEAYDCENRKTAKTNGHKNLQKPTVSRYINKILKDIESSRIADIREVMEFYTSVMRGDMKNYCPLSDRIKAASELAKRLDLKDIENKGKEPMVIEIVDRRQDKSAEESWMQ